MKTIAALFFFILGFQLYANNEVIEIQGKSKNQNDVVAAPSLTIFPGDYGKSSTTREFIISESSIKIPVGVTLIATADIVDNQASYTCLFILDDFKKNSLKSPNSSRAALLQRLKVLSSGKTDFGKEFEIKINTYLPILIQKFFSIIPTPAQMIFFLINNF